MTKDVSAESMLLIAIALDFIVATYGKRCSHRESSVFFVWEGTITTEPSNKNNNT